MDELGRMFKTQLEFQRKIFPDFDTLSEERKRNLTKDYVLHSLTEIDELLSNIGEWKTHKVKKSMVRKSGINEELVDIMKFVINIAVTWGITPFELIEKFKEKTIINEQKFLWQTKAAELRDKPIAIFDIDGVLNDYPRRFVDFVNSKLDKSYGYETYLNLPEAIDYMVYEDLKTEFREDESDNIHYTEDIRPVFQRIKDAGIFIVLLTSRPMEHKKTFNEAIISLMKREIPFDLFLSDPKKALRIAKDFRNVKFFVDDEPKFVEEVSKLGAKVYLANAPYNDLYSCKGGITRVFSLEEVLDHEKINGG